MKWKGSRRSSNVEDRRGQSSGGSRGFSSINPMLLGPLLRLLFSKKGLIVAAVFLGISFLTGNNPLNFLVNYYQEEEITEFNLQNHIKHQKAKMN